MRPAWLDPRYMPLHRLIQLERHDIELRQVERELAERRIQALMPSKDDKPCREEADWRGCTL